MIGLLTLQAARHAGAGQITVLDIDDTRLAMARTLGATRTINSQDQGCVRDLMAQTGGRGADSAFECVGNSVTVRLAIDVVRKGGQVTLIGNVAPTVEMNLQSVVTRQIRLQGSCASSGEYERVIALMADGALQVAPLISAIAPLQDGADWFERLYDRAPGLLKVVLQP